MRTDSALSGILIQETNSAGEITLAQFNGLAASIPTTASKFAVGCLVTPSSDGKPYYNAGTVASPSWNAVSDIVVSEISLTTGSVLIGAAGIGAALDVKGSGKILVGNGTTATSVAVSGDATLSSAGALTVTGAAAGFNVGTNQTFTKEVNHTVAVAASTTADTAGGTLTISSAAGAGTGAGGALSYTSGAGANGAAAVNGGASGAVTVSSGVAGTSGTGTGGASGTVNVAAAAGGATTGAAGVGGKAGDVKLTGAAGGADGEGGSGTGGEGSSVILTAGMGGAGNTTGVNGAVFARGLNLRSQGAAAAKTTSATLTAAEVMSQLITINQGAGGTSAQQLPTVSDLEVALPTSLGTFDSFDVAVMNISTVDAEDATVTTNTGWTLVGEFNFPADSDAGAGQSLNTRGIIRLQKTGAGAWSAFRIS